MNRSVVCVSLKYQYARPFVIVRIVFDYDGTFHSCHDIAQQYTIGSQFVIAVGRHPDVPAFDQVQDSSKCIAHIAVVTCDRLIEIGLER